MVSKEQRKREKARDRMRDRRLASNAGAANNAVPMTDENQPPPTPTTPAPDPKKTRVSDISAGAFCFPSTSRTPLSTLTNTSTPATELRSLSLVADTESTPRGRSIKSTGDTDLRSRSLSKRGIRISHDINQPASSGTITITRSNSTRRSSRLADRNLQSLQGISARMEQVKIDYLNRPWPMPQNASVRRQHRRSSSISLQKCGGNCDCDSYGQCHQNAVAFLAASNYMQRHDPEQKNTKDPPTFRTTKNVRGGRPTGRCHTKTDFKCASNSARHRVDYYDSGRFGDKYCDNCGAVLLRGEYEKIKKGRLSPCCSDGACDTEEMRAGFDDLQHPPTEPVNYKAELIESPNDKLREAFLNNTMPLNNTFGFASISSEKAPEDQLGGRKNACKYNGEFSFQFSDLIAPEGRRPTFAQVYTLDPETAVALHKENLSKTIPSAIKEEIIEKLHQLMHTNPFGQTFESVGNHIRNAEQKSQEIPHFQDDQSSVFKVVLLTNREIKDDAIKKRGDCLVIERTDAPTAKQVAVVWVQDEANLKLRPAGKPQVATNPPNDQSSQNPPLERGSVIAGASTGIASLLLIGGATVHRQFYVPNDVDKDTPPTINFESKKAEQLRVADLIIIDEISMLSNKVFQYIDRLLRDVCANEKPFGGKIVVLGGDWKQLAPVVEHGTREDQVKDSIRMDPLFRDYSIKLSLTQNMRTAPGEDELRRWLLAIGNGLHQVDDSTTTPGLTTNLLPIPNELLASNLDDVLNFCFPPALFDDPTENAVHIAHNAILCPTNIAVQSINDLALDRMSGSPITYPSLDEPLEPRDNIDEFRTDFNIETINNETPSGMPPHKLVLKVGAPVMLIRNMDVSQGLCNGTRLQVMKLTAENIYCRILTGPRADTKQIHIIPRVKFEYGRSRHHRGLRFRRLQFPVRPCFAMTVNKAQGQTLKRMALVLTGGQCFSHGQVYVAMSRVTQMEGIKIYAPNCQIGDSTYIKNVVYHELLDGVNIEPRPQIMPNAQFQAGNDAIDSDSETEYQPI